MAWLSSGCQGERDVVMPFAESFLFSDIEYFLEAGDGIFDKTTPERSAGGTNYTHLGGTFAFYPLSGMEEMSSFSTGELDQYEFDVPETSLIPIPREIDDGKITLSEPKALFCPYLPEYFPGERNQEKVYLRIPPHSELTYDFVIHYKHLKTGFRAIFTGNITGRELVVKGKWEGTQVVGFEGKSTIRAVL